MISGQYGACAQERMKPARALFLDRDGVINKDFGYVHKKEDFVFIEDIFLLVAAARGKGYLTVVVTNQAGIGRGYYTEEDFSELMVWVEGEFCKQGAGIDAVYFCPFHPVHGIGAYKRESEFRKPEPGMFLLAAREHAIDLGASVLVGDSPTDMRAGQAAGVGSLFFLTQDGAPMEGVQSITRLAEVIPFL
jgi:D-glycero-D-manno-heptose 1,7-bisphosphate phosphatase